MIRSVTITNYLGESVTCVMARPWDTGFAITSITGLGPGSASVVVSEVSTDDGANYNSARLSTRNIVLTVRFLENTTIEESRILSYKYFPIKRKVTLRIETDTRSVEISGYVESNEPDIFSSEESTSISILCPDPYFYSVGEDELTTTVFSTTNALFEFPFSNESTTEALLEMSERLAIKEFNVVYNGDLEIGVTITITAVGSVSNLTLYNVDTGEKMFLDTDKLEEFTGSGIITGDQIVICTVKKKKSVSLIRDGVTTNILNCLSRDSDWFQLTKGDNNFAYTVESGDNNIQVQIENQTVYEGV